MGSGEIKCQRVWIRSRRWAQFGTDSPILGLPVTQTGNFTLLAGHVHYVDVAGGSVVLATPPIHSSSTPSGERFVIHLVTDNVNTATISAPAGGTIQGGSSFVMKTTGQMLTFERHLTDWVLVGANAGVSVFSPDFNEIILTDEVALSGGVVNYCDISGVTREVKMPLSPLNRETVHIINENNQIVTILGNGRNIQGAASTTQKKDTEAVYQYRSVKDIWTRIYGGI